MSEHPLVAAYMADFDAAAFVLPPARRLVLREEILAHLGDAIAPDMTDRQVAAVLLGLGSPASIVSEEEAAPSLSRPVSRRKWLRVLLIVLAIASGILAIVVMGPSAIAYVWGPPGVIFSAFVWTLGAVLVLSSVSLTIAATRLRPKSPAS